MGSFLAQYKRYSVIELIRFLWIFLGKLKGNASPSVLVSIMAGTAPGHPQPSADSF